MPQYKYAPIDVEASEIRLLTILPGKKGSYIYVELDHVPLIKERPPEFEALSYAWGSAQSPGLVYIGQSSPSNSDVKFRFLSNQPFLFVTQNLASALQHLRYEDKKRVMWIDAICVDQLNFEERSQQVQRMADIYRCASRVVVWLGPESRSSIRAMDLLETMGSKIDVDWISLTIKPAVNSGEDTRWPEPSDNFPYALDDINAMDELFQMPWFERLWIRQEITLAEPGAMLVCGMRQIPWSIFRKAIFCLQNKYNRMNRFNITLKENIFFLYELCDLDNPLPLRETVRQTARCKCTDPRDRIYAVLSIVPEVYDVSGKALLVPDYDKSVTDVFKDIVFLYLENFGYNNHTMLSSCEMRDKASITPSWIPDFSVPRLANGLMDHFASCQSRAKWEYQREREILRCRGVNIGTVLRCYDISMSKTFKQALQNISQFILSNYDTEDGKALEIFCRTLCDNSFKDRLDNPTFLDIRQAVDLVQKAIRTERAEGLDAALIEGGDGLRYFLNFANYNMNGRLIFAMDGNKFGVGPAATELSDLIVVFTGCNSPIVLRPMHNGAYRIVGECYIHEYMSGEALLGPLPDVYKLYVNVDESGAEKYSFINQKSGETRLKDPRLDFLRTGIFEDGRKAYFLDSGLTNGFEGREQCGNDAVEMLIKLDSEVEEDEEVYLVGVNLEDFDLV